MPSVSPPTLSTNQEQFKIEFVGGPKSEFECPVCHQAFRYPVQFDQCNHHCCSSCLTQLVKSSVEARCPTCNSPIKRDRVFVDKDLQKNIQNQRVKCSVRARKCFWSGQLKNLQGHLEECIYVTVKCSNNCGVYLQRRFLERHLIEDCDKRDITCEYCLLQVKQEGLEDHLEACLSYPLDCPNACGVKDIPRIALTAHFDKCLKAGAACPFNEFGCDHKAERKTLQKHIRDEPTRHLALICEGVVDLKRMLQTMKMNAERIGRKMGDLDKKTTSLEKLYGSQMLWKIDEYEDKIKAAKADTGKTTIFSPIFHTGRHGYRMALSACLYGDGPARSKFMSVFICICRGEYDALLTWPFNHKITLTLLDQAEDPSKRKNMSLEIKPGSGKENQSFLLRPTAERNSSFGAQKFIELGRLDEHDYVKDDCMYIKAHIHTEDMTPL